MKILVVSPHCDDAEIGMGGTIARYVSEGHKVTILNAIIPCEYRDGTIDEEFKVKRKQEQLEASKILGCDINFLDLNPYEFEFNRNFSKLFDSYIEEFAPNMIFSCWENDSHQDHQTISKIMSVVTRKNTCSYYMYETMIPGGIGTKAFNPQLLINVSGHIDKKLESINQYKSAFGENIGNILDSVKGRCRFRGEQIGVRYAESFEIVKEIKL